MEETEKVLEPLRRWQTRIQRHRVHFIEIFSDFLDIINTETEAQGVYPGAHS